MNKKELAKKLVDDRLSATDTYHSKLDRINEQYEKDAAELDKPLKWPLVSDTGVALSTYGIVYEIGVNCAHAALIDRGAVYNSYEEAELHDKRRLAEMRVTRRIAGINREENWEADWSNYGQNKHFVVYKRDTDRLRINYAWRVQDKPPHWYGCEKAIKTVIEEMPESCKVMLGVEND